MKLRKPDWMKIRIPGGKEYVAVKDIIEKNKLHTICSSGRCPNMAECWGLGTATLMILGDVCTRACKFCATKTGKPLPLDSEEPARTANTVSLLKLKHCVITSVDRDDLPDKGANHWFHTISEVKLVNPNTTIEVLIPDFDAITELIEKVISAGPEVIAHNLETVERLTPTTRSRAKYQTSLKVIRILSSKGVRAKSGLMLGLGETKEEVYKTMDDLVTAGCKILTLGQYLQPTKNHLEVAEYITPEMFKEYEIVGLSKGFEIVESGPLVRSSYHAGKHV
jgi:lipoyl synthase